MLLSLMLPIILSAVALFFASYLSWMVLQLHKRDWIKFEKEEEFIDAVRGVSMTRGSYAFPCYNSPEEMKSEEYRQKWKAGPCGIITVFPEPNIGRNLALTFLYFFAVSFCLGYLAQLHIGKGAEFLDVFRFVATAGVMTYLAAIVQHAIWFHGRIIGT